MAAYATEDEAIDALCLESLGYAAAAFAAKYITQRYPDLKLPGSGPSSTCKNIIFIEKTFRYVIIIKALNKDQKIVVQKNI